MEDCNRQQTHHEQMNFSTNSECKEPLFMARSNYHKAKRHLLAMVMADLAKHLFESTSLRAVLLSSPLTSWLTVPNSGQDCSIPLAYHFSLRIKQNTAEGSRGSEAHSAPQIL